MVLSLFRQSTIALALLSLALAGCDDFLKYSPGQQAEVRRVRNRASERIAKVKHALLNRTEVDAVLNSWSRYISRDKNPKTEQLYFSGATIDIVEGTERQQFDASSWAKEGRGKFIQQLSSAKSNSKGTKNEPFEFQNRMNAFSSTNVIHKSELTSQGATDDSTKVIAQVTLIIARSNGKLGIVSELWQIMHNPEDAQRRLLDSRTPADPEEFSFVTPSHSGLALLLGPIEEQTLSGENPIYKSGNQAEHSVNEKLLKPGILKLKNKIFRIYSRSGLSCVGRVTGFVAIARIQPHFSLTESWKGKSLKEYVSPKRRAVDIWNLSQAGGRSLAATLTTEGECKGAWWAQESEWPSPAIWSQRAPTNEEKTILTEYVHVAPEFRSLQRSFRKHYESTAYWDETTGSQREMRLFENGSGAQFASVQLRAGIDNGCSSAFDPDLWLLFEKEGPRKYKLVSAAMKDQAPSLWPRLLLPLQAEAAFDLNGDGRPEFIGGHDFIRSYGDGYQSVLNLAPAYFSSPC